MSGKKIIFAVFIFIFILSGTIPTFASTSPTITRLAGIDRYATAAAIANRGWKQSDYVVIAYGENYPDALSAAPLASKYKAPILLTTSNNLPTITKQTLVNLQVKNVFIIGGTGVIALSVEAELQSMGMKTTRIAGQDRYETAIQVAKQIKNPNKLFVVSGEDYPDALSIAPIAAICQMPIILVPKDNLPNCVKDYYASVRQSVGFTYVVGDSDIIDDDVYNSFYNPLTFERIKGTNKYERNIAINQKFNDSFNSDSFCLATGENFADALTGSVYAAKIKEPIIFIKDAPENVTADYYQEQLKVVNEINVFGGTAVVSDDLIQNLATTHAVIFKDKNLENIIRNTINKSSGNISVDDLKNIDFLYANGLEIKDLAGIENCTNLKYLFLDDNQIKDISPLQYLTNLVVLHLKNNGISDNSTSLTLQGLANRAPFLEDLSVDGNNFIYSLTLSQQIYLRSSQSTTLIDNISTTINQNDNYTLPSMVVARLYKGVPGFSVGVKWHPSTIDTSKVGTYECLGTVDNYNGVVTLTVKVIGKQ